MGCFSQHALDGKQRRFNATEIIALMFVVAKAGVGGGGGLSCVAL